MKTLVLAVTLVAFLGMTLADDLNLRLLRRIMDALETTEGEHELAKRGGLHFMRWDRATSTISVYLVSTTICRKAGACAYEVYFTGSNDRPLSKRINLIWYTNTDKDGKKKFKLTKDGDFEGVKMNKEGDTSSTGGNNVVDVPGTVNIHVCRIIDEESVKASDCSVRQFDTAKRTDDGRSIKFL